MIHYHGTPITPLSKLEQMAGRNLCVRYGEHDQVETCFQIAQAVMLDNGAYPAWTKGVGTDWLGFYEWVETWLDYQTAWAVIPDVIDGDAAANDALILEWPFGNRGSPVWHLHEPIDRLKRLVDTWPRVCFGSSGEYADPTSYRWRCRIDEAFNAICDDLPSVWIHMLRAMKQACEGPWPFASADSTNTARNHHRHASPLAIAAYWDGIQPPPRWVPRMQEVVA